MTPEFLLYGDIGRDMWGDGIDANQIAQWLSTYRGAPELCVRINSAGGVICDGVTIYNLLTQCGSRVITKIDGYALSAASIVAMAGTEVHMAENAMMMIHDARQTLRSATASEMRSAADVSDKHTDVMAATYARRGKIDKAEALSLMAAETWLTAEEALAKGLCTKMTSAERVEASFDISKYGYAKASHYASLMGRPIGAHRAGEQQTIAPLAACASLQQFSAQPRSYRS